MSATPPTDYPFESFARGPNDPAVGGFAITPSDTLYLDHTARGLQCGTAGDVKVEGYNGDVFVIPNMAPGVLHPWLVRKVFATGTTAGNIIGGR